MSSKKLTPLMEQYFDIREQYPDTLLFFQVGDFYELFFDDAKKASAYLGIALTTRGKNEGEPIPLCGVPMHAKDHYLHKLIKGGFKVAVCDQLEQATPGKLVKRAVTQVLTPGTLTDSTLLDDKSSSYLFSFYPGKKESALVFAELLTGQLWATLVPAQEQRVIESELARFFPDELILPQHKDAKEWVPFFKKQGYFTTVIDANSDDDSSFESQWLNQFPQKNKDIIQEHEPLRLALFYFYAYISKTQRTSLEQFNQLFVYKPDDFLIMDAATQRNLELMRNNQDGSRFHTLYELLDGASTPMGSRMIKKWIARPLIKKGAIEQRQEVVGQLMADVIQLQTYQQLLSPLGDVERVVGRIALSRAQLYDYCMLKRSLAIIPDIKQQLSQSSALLFGVIASHLSDFNELYSFLDRALVDEPSSSTIIKKGFDQQLDYMRELISSSNQKMLQMEREEIEQTGISSLKIRYNNVHGYYIEITNANKHLVPEQYERRQTLVGKERYTTPALTQLAYEIERAHAQIQDREKLLFDQVKQQVMGWVAPLRKLAHALAHLDALHGIAKVSYNNGYTKPVLTDSQDITIIDGRHPVIERHSDAGFIPNDTKLNDAQSLWIITGPNMGGKSTYLRQVALICIMAQCGSFVPAKSAEIPVLDRVFTRIGAGDNLAAGKSTFLVEMEETASICSQATAKSLVILDEVGRGTSTFDGLAIAQAVIEYLYTSVGARCLFATHYHELTQLSATYPGIAPVYAASTKTASGIVFLYKMVHGVADGSFGIEVAKLADLPSFVIDRAQELLILLDAGHQPTIQKSNQNSQIEHLERLLQENKTLKNKLANGAKEAQLRAELDKINLDELSPRAAFDMIWRLKQG